MKPLAFALLALVAGCGGASPALVSAYTLEQARCYQNERDIIDRQGTTEEQDYADMAAERERCAAALAAIEHGGQ